MMNMRSFYLSMMSIVLASLSFGYDPPPLPSSDDPEEFSRQAEAFIVERVKSGPSLLRDDNPEWNRPLVEDKRDWESTLARIIGDPEKYGFNTSRSSLNVAIFRGNAAKPEIVSATRRYFEISVRMAEASYEHYASQGNPKHPSIWGHLAGAYVRLLRIGVPEYLSMVLDYFSSPSEEKLQLIDRQIPEVVASSLREYGDHTHVEGAKKLVAKLRDVGKDEIADDIDRSIERIERDQKRSDAERVGEGSSPDSATSDGGKQEGEEGVFTFPWIVGGVVVVVIISAGVFFLKRKG